MNIPHLLFVIYVALMTFNIHFTFLFVIYVVQINNSEPNLFFRASPDTTLRPPQRRLATQTLSYIIIYTGQFNQCTIL